MDPLNNNHPKTSIQNKDSLAPTPPMGWNSWNAFGRNINEAKIKETVDAFMDHGLKDLGYNFIVIDDHWHGGRDEHGRLYCDREKFPNGMKAIADYVHSNGLKFGIYSCAGDKTCGGEPGSYGYEEIDAQTFADWEVDFLKYDYCYTPDTKRIPHGYDYKEAIARYTKMGHALKATGRPILFSICEWGPRSPWLWGKEAGGSMWRVSYDVCDFWDLPRNSDSPIGILNAIDVMADKERYSGPEGWNDPDMLVVGLNGSGYVPGPGCTEIEYQTQMSMWCMLAAPLMVGNDIRTMSDSTKRILTNPEIIAINQDSKALQGYRVHRRNGLEVWKKPLSGNRLAVALLNRSEVSATIAAKWDVLELKPSDAYTVRDVWAHEDLGAFKEMVSFCVLPHECKVFLFTLQ
jgi:alpha-galactosidase